MFLGLIGKLVARRIPEISLSDVEREVHARNSRAGRAIAERLTRGNVAIQSGDMLLEEDLELRGARNPQEID